MPVTVKSAREIELMRKAGRILAKTHEELAQIIKPGIATQDIDRACREIIKENGGTPSFLHYKGFPAAICVSVNDEIVHGIPSENRILQEGGIVSLDAGVSYEGYHSDAARTYGIGQISCDARKLIEVTRQSFFEGIRFAREGNHLYDISNAVDAYIRPFGYGIVRELTGHGIGRRLHEAPAIPNYRQWRRGLRLQAGMTIAVEPMVTTGRAAVQWMSDGWTVTTRDGSLAAHYENTVLITDHEPEILSMV